VAFTASEELRDKLERLQALIPGGDLASIIDTANSMVSKPNVTARRTSREKTSKMPTPHRAFAASPPR